MNTSKTLLKLKANPRVDDVEDEGCDEGRFFVHIKNDWSFEPVVFGPVRSKTFAKVREALSAVNKAYPITE